MGGTISGEHGDGLSRTWFLREQYGPLYSVFVQLKRIFDPQGDLESRQDRRRVGAVAGAEPASGRPRRAVAGRTGRLERTGRSEPSR